MIKITINNEERMVPVGTMVLDLLPENEKTKYLVCQINQQIKELRYRLSERNDGATISFKQLNNIEAGKAYEASLRLVTAMAFRNLYPEMAIRFSYNVSRSIFCQILTPGIHLMKICENIKNEINRIISLNLPIERINVDRETATKIYGDLGHYDKIDILKYRPENNIHLHKVGDYYNYMHGYVVPSTGCLTNFIIRPYSPGLVIQYPRYELNAQIPAFQEESTYGRTLKHAYTWGQLTKTQTIVDINRKIEEGNTVDFIQMCETKHTNMLAELGEHILKDITNLRLIAIAGPSSSGKTTFCNRLRIELMSRGINPVMISMDNYYLSREQIAKIQNTSPEDVDLEHINCLDVDLFNQNLFDLINGETVVLPRFNFNTGKREEGNTLHIEPNSPIIIEGIHALNERLTSSIPKHQKFKIYIAPQMQINIDNHSPLNTTDLRLIRRIVRDMKFRNCPAANTINMWQSVRDGEFKWIYPNQEGANYVFNSELTYELAVLRTHALPALREIKPTDPEYLVANRLIKYLKYFRPIEDESIIPCNSLLREFIGDSCFNVND